MSLMAKEPESGGGNYEPIPEDTYQGICYGIYDLGTQYNRVYDKQIHKVLIAWEIPEFRIEITRDGVVEDLPRAISNRYTLSLHEKSSLRKMLEGWRGKKFTAEELTGFDILNVLGVNCMIQVVHNVKEDKTYANVQNVTKLYKSMAVLKAENPLSSFSFETDDDIPDGTPDWIVNVIKESDEWQGWANKGLLEQTPSETAYNDSDNAGDDVPF